MSDSSGLRSRLDKEAVISRLSPWSGVGHGCKHPVAIYRWCSSLVVKVFDLSEKDHVISAVQAVYHLAFESGDAIFNIWSAPTVR